MKLMSAGFFTTASRDEHGFRVGSPVMSLNFPPNTQRYLRLPEFSLVIVLCDGAPGPFTLVGRINGPTTTSQMIKETYEWPPEAWHFIIIRSLQITLEYEGPGFYTAAFTIDGEPLVDLTLPLLPS